MTGDAGRSAGIPSRCDLGRQPNWERSPWTQCWTMSTPVESTRSADRLRTPAEEEAVTPTLTPPPEAAAPPAANERCDRCTAAGKLRVVLAGGGDLVFCGHHANKYAPELVKIAVEVVSAPDFTWRGNELTRNDALKS